MRTARSARAALLRSIFRSPLAGLVQSPFARRVGLFRLIHRTLWRFLGDWEYQDDYATFDPDRYWRFVGSPTEQEFLETGRRIFDGLRRDGLRPDSAVLDVGCGTGRVAAHLAVHLSDAGHYVGVDIAEAAVRFCAGRYARPNFSFVLNEGTTLPVSGRFDLILFFSVFTHMYPNEMDPMLHSAAALLAPGGKVIASFLFSSDPGAYTDGVTTWTGNRTRIEYARTHLDHLLTRAGFSYQEEDWELGQKVLVMTPSRSSQDVEA